MWINNICLCGFFCFIEIVYIWVKIYEIVVKVVLIKYNFLLIKIWYIIFGSENKFVFFMC